MTKKVWLAAAMVALVGCGGQVASVETRLEPEPQPLPLPDPKPLPDPRPTDIDPSRQLPPPVPADPGRPVTPSPEPSPTDPEPPSPLPEPDDLGVTPPGPCHTLLTDAAGTHLAILTFATKVGASRVDIGASLALDPDVAKGISSLGRQGDSLYACSAGTVLRIALGDASLETSDVSCDAVTADDAAIWVQSTARGALERYDGWSALLAGETSATFAPIDAPRIGVQGSVVVGSADGADRTTRILRLDTATGATSEITLGLRGPHMQGIDLGADGYLFASYSGRGYARYGWNGSFTYLGATDASWDFHGIVCQ